MFGPIRLVWFFLFEAYAMPRNWTAAHWVSETNVAGTVWGLKSRSALLLAVDQALVNFEKPGAPTARLAALRTLQDAWDAWGASKTDLSASIRNKNGTLINDFREWMEDREMDLMPTPEANWNGTPNCYAYAMKCRDVVGNAPTPGAFAGSKVIPFDPRWGGEAAVYHAELFGAIVADARACDKNVTVLRQVANNIYPTPDAPPVTQVERGHYLAAMVVKRDGFHFMRRDSTSGLWSHKNGGGAAEVETSAGVVSPIAGRLVRHIPITDAVAVDLLRCTTPGYLGFSGFTFAGYLSVPEDGITVQGGS